MSPGHGHGNASGTHHMISGCWSTDPGDPVPNNSSGVQGSFSIQFLLFLNPIIIA